MQALKYEKISQESGKDPTEDSSLARFLISRAAQNLKLGNFFHWYLMVECDEFSPAQGAEYRKLYSRIEYEFMTELLKVKFVTNVCSCVPLLIKCGLLDTRRTRTKKDTSPSGRAHHSPLEDLQGSSILTW